MQGDVTARLNQIEAKLDTLLELMTPKKKTAQIGDQVTGTSKVFGDKEWQLLLAYNTFLSMEKKGYLVPSLANMKKSSYSFWREMQKWADTIDKLHRIDGMEKRDIKELFDWLLNVDEFWFTQGNLQKISMLRVNNSRGTKKIDTIRIQYDKWKKGESHRGSVPKPVVGRGYTKFDMDRMIKTFPHVVKEDFLSRVNTDNQDGLEYVYKLEAKTR